VISNVVPKIWARTNSAMVMCVGEDVATGASGSVYRGEVVVVLLALGESRVNRFARRAT
jgi:hypothetical protein